MPRPYDMLLNAIESIMFFLVRLHVGLIQRTVLQRPFCPSVCPSVKRVHCDKTKETCAYILIPYKKPYLS